MKPKTKKIIIWSVGVYVAICICYAIVLSVTDSNKQQESPIAEQTPTTKIINTEDDAVFKRLKTLYGKLLEFKGDKSFHLYGFGEGSEYNGWFKAAHNFTKEDDQHLMRTYGVVSGDLLMLAQEYIKSKGKETEYSENMCKQFDNIFVLTEIEVTE